MDFEEPRRIGGRAGSLYTAPSGRIYPKSAQLPETPLTVRNLAEGATVADRPSWRSPGP
jgi:hypothetical protein